MMVLSKESQIHSNAILTKVLQIKIIIIQNVYHSYTIVMTFLYSNMYKNVKSIYFKNIFFYKYHILYL